MRVGACPAGRRGSPSGRNLTGLTVVAAERRCPWAQAEEGPTRLAESHPEITLAIVVPVTSVDRGWPNHIPVAGSTLPQRSWAMTEQVRTISRTRITGRLGRVTSDTLAEIRLWIQDFLDL